MVAAIDVAATLPVVCAECRALLPVASAVVKDTPSTTTASESTQLNWIKRIFFMILSLRIDLAGHQLVDINRAFEAQCGWRRLSSDTLDGRSLNQQYQHFSTRATDNG